MTPAAYRSAPQEPERPQSGAELVRALITVLKEIVSNKDFFLLSNHSMYEVLKIYEEPLLTAVREGEGLQLLRSWQEDAEAFREVWSTSPEGRQVIIEHQSMQIATEGAAKHAHRTCAERKQKPRAR